MSDIDKIKEQALAATRELMKAVELAEVAADGITMGIFEMTEIDDAEAALIMVRSCLIAIEDQLQAMKQEARA